MTARKAPQTARLPLWTRPRGALGLSEKRQKAARFVSERCTEAVPHVHVFTQDKYYYRA